ncbi:Acetyltransferase (GNAT) domain-containing protein [Nannocystis exedens]|uniref:Acetyltransferase (GNAT) domain-containing protein n=1 Tax=Nannocystis exedens TaxID=54 RepID=A0A1I2DND9_9BACT|nr:GNAT family N-acetyltransferase [Nannocystis exedens]PCC69032.1 GNAT family N-acetyltransferase [Nannocystis exedens]SFE81987.1 Acetyltransferase (GNAT) domain-containing protein [Nannocystis exedens]
MAEETDCFITTARLQVRRFRAEDAPTLVAYRADPEVARYQGWTQFDEAEAREFIAGLRASRPGVPGVWYQFALALLSEGTLIGDVGLRVTAGEPTTADIGYTLMTAQQGRGLASEAVRAVCEYAFSQLGVRRIQATVDDRNVRSLALARRLGMIEEAAVETIWRGEPCVDRIFVLTRG